MKQIRTLTLILTALAAILAATPAEARHRPLAPKHAHLVKHAQTLNVTVHIPSSAYKKAAIRPRKAKKRRK